MHIFIQTLLIYLKKMYIISLIYDCDTCHSKKNKLKHCFTDAHS